MTEWLRQLREKKDIGFAVESSDDGKHHLSSNDANLKTDQTPTGGVVSEQPQYGLANVGDKRVLVGWLSFSVANCTPNNGSADPSSCQGRGLIVASSDSLLSSNGMSALKVGDKGRCVGIGRKGPYPVPVSCEVCIGRSLQLELDSPQNVDAGVGKTASEAESLNQFRFRLQYEEGTPCSGAAWKAVGSSGTEKQGKLNDAGEGTCEMPDESCTVAFAEFDPSIDARASAKRDHAIELFTDLTKAGRELGLNTAVELLDYWRNGGDDQQAEKRPDVCWTDMFGRGHEGKRLPHTVFSKDYLSEVVRKLAKHRDKYIQATKDRVADRRINKTSPFADMHWENTSGNWLASDIQVGFGHCTIYSKARVRAIDPMNLGLFTFDSWEVALADRYDWEHGRSWLPGVMPLMNILYFVRYWSAENPQEILHSMEEPYGFGDATMKRVYARPFDIETEFYSFSNREARILFEQFSI